MSGGDTTRPRHAIPARSPLLAAAALLALSRTAFAHTDHGAAGGFVSGLAHPVSGLDHVVAMVAVGIWGAQLGAPAVWALPVVFPAVMALGGALGLAGIALPGVEVGIALSAIVLGAMVLVEKRPRLPVAIALVGAFAIFHGHAHGTELPEGENGLLYSIAFVLATGTLHAAGIALGLLRRFERGRIGLRVAGGAIALVGAWSLVRTTWEAP